MSKFTRLQDWCERHEDGYITTKELTWEVGRAGSGLNLVVPIGTPFDVTIFWWLKWLFDEHDPRYLKGAALHDYTLSDGWDRVSAAAAFSDALKVSGVRRFRRLVMTFGTIIWKWW